MIDNINADPDYGDGRAAYEAFEAYISKECAPELAGIPAYAFDDISETSVRAWEAAAKAVRDRAIAAQQPQPAPGLRKALEELVNFWAVGGNGIDAASEDLISACSAELLRVLDQHPEQPAPELAAAMRETADVRDGYAKLCEEFSDSPQSGQSARISLTVLNRHRVRAGLDALKPGRTGLT